MAPFKLSFFVALFIAIPYVLFQIWAFVAPGLYKHEKRFALPLIRHRRSCCSTSAWCSRTRSCSR